jgi:hypothetical protein
MTDAEPERPQREWLENEGPQLNADEIECVTVEIPAATAERPRSYALFAGRVHRFSAASGNPSGLGPFVELEHETRFELEGKAQTSRFFTLYGGLEDIAVGMNAAVNAGDPVGEVPEDGGTPRYRVAIYTMVDDPVWRRQTQRPPILVDGYYFWDPSSVLNPP